MMRKAKSSIEEVPYCFLGSSIKIHGHTGWKIDNLNPVWVRLLGRSQLSNPSDLPCFNNMQHKIYICIYIYYYIIYCENKWNTTAVKVPSKSYIQDERIIYLPGTPLWWDDILNIAVTSSPRKYVTFYGVLSCGLVMATWCFSYDVYSFIFHSGGCFGGETNYPEKQYFLI